MGAPGLPLLRTEAALRLGLLVHACGYEVEPAPRAHGVDFGAVRNGTVWATFHLESDAHDSERLRLGATVFGGARQDAPTPLTPTLVPPETAQRLEAFVRDRLRWACKRGCEQDSKHCADCPDRDRHLRGRFDP